MEGDKSASRYNLIYMALFLFTGVFVFAFSFIVGKSYEAILRNTVVSMLSAGTVLFMIKDATGRGPEGFSYDNYYRKRRFVIVFAGMVVLSCVLSLVPNEFWPYMSLFVILALFSNSEIGMIAGISFTTISVMLEENGSFGELLMYVLAGAVAIAHCYRTSGIYISFDAGCAYNSLQCAVPEQDTLYKYPDTSNT